VHNKLLVLFREYALIQCDLQHAELKSSNWY